MGLTFEVGAGLRSSPWRGRGGFGQSALPITSNYTLGIAVLTFIAGSQTMRPTLGER